MYIDNTSEKKSNICGFNNIYIVYFVYAYIYTLPKIIKAMT